MKPTTQKLRPAIYREAARRIGEGESASCCAAIAEASGNIFECSEESRIFVERFKPRNFICGCYWNVFGGEEESITPRIIALELCALMAGEDKRSK